MAVGCERETGRVPSEVVPVSTVDLTIVVWERCSSRPRALEAAASVDEREEIESTRGTTMRESEREGTGV